MKKFSHSILFVLTIATLLLSACGGVAATPTPNTGAGKAEPIPVAFLGIVDSMAGDQWVINGQTVTVSPDVLRDGPFQVGDQVKVEGVVTSDGSFSVSRVEAPTPQDSSSLPQFGNDNSNDANSNDVNGIDANSNDSNVNDVNSNDDNGNTANTNDVNANDDNGNTVSSNDDNSNSVSPNDDSNVNDDNGNDSNLNDDQGSDDNSEDSNGNDDHSGSGGNDNGGNDDHGGDDNNNDD